MRFMSHNWSSTKRRLHPHSVAAISRHSVLSGDRIRQCETSSGSRHKDTDQCKSRHFLQAWQCPCYVRKRFSRDHCCRGRPEPGCRIVGLHTRWELTTWADFQLCLHRLLMSTGCKSSSCRRIAIPFGAWKLEWCGYPTVKKMEHSVFILTRCRNVTDTHTDTAWRHRPHLCIASRVKKLIY